MDKNDDDNFKVNVVGADDQKLKLLGELLRNETSRKIIRYLMENETYLNELSKKLELQPNLVVHHLKKLKDAKLVTITKKKIIRKGVERNYYKMNPYFFVAPNKTMDEIKEKGILKKIFKESVKFASIGMAVCSSWIITNNIIKDQDKKITRGSESVSTEPNIFENLSCIDISNNSFCFEISLLPVIVAITTGFILIKIFYLKKKN